MMMSLGLLDRAQRRPYAASVAMIVIVTALGFAAAPLLHPANLDVLYLVPVFVSALYCGERPAIFTAVLGAVVFNFCFIPPRFSWAITDLAYLVTLLVFVAVGIVTSRLASQARQRVLEHAAREHAEALTASKDALLHKISHELRSPMTAVLGWTQLLRINCADDDDLSGSLSGLENSAQLLRRMIEDLLEASRAASGKLSVRLQPTMLAPVVAKALDVVAISAQRKNIALQRTLQNVTVLADEVRIEQIVTNLVTNAIKFTPAGGQVAVALTQAAGQACISVSDSGSGIAKEFLPHVFEPFSQADAGRQLARRSRPRAVDREASRRGARRHDFRGERRTWPRYDVHRRAADARSEAAPAAR